MNIEELEARLARIEARLDGLDHEMGPIRAQRLKREAAQALADALEDALKAKVQHRFTDDEQ